ncbi:hypothetical protein CDAR_583551 [Caerostris darwini]|uniref:Uncharacterized protein n=1 Tax=Caerostris darwini TaxID=1538125 RepID=A0AAV4PTX9_9ARAC|nr:hypothetical protein CDAR_583551 [Caerostris darwini]
MLILIRIKNTQNWGDDVPGITLTGKFTLSRTKYKMPQLYNSLFETGLQKIKIVPNFGAYSTMRLYFRLFWWTVLHGFLVNCACHKGDRAKTNLCLAFDADTRCETRNARTSSICKEVDDPNRVLFK